MSTHDRHRHGLVGGLLVAFAVGLVAAGRILEMSVIALAPAYMFTPMLAGLAGIVTFGLAAAVIDSRGTPTLDRSFATGEPDTERPTRRSVITQKVRRVENI